MASLWDGRTGKVNSSESGFALFSNIPSLPPSLTPHLHNTEEHFLPCKSFINCVFACQLLGLQREIYLSLVLGKLPLEFSFVTGLLYSPSLRSVLRVVCWLAAIWLLNLPPLQLSGFTLISTRQGKVCLGSGFLSTSDWPNLLPALESQLVSASASTRYPSLVRGWRRNDVLYSDKWGVRETANANLHYWMHYLAVQISV